MVEDMDKELAEALETSIEMEEEGRRFYLEAAKKLTNEFGKKVFEALADDETRHIAAIRKYCVVVAKKKSAKLCNVMPMHKGIAERILFGQNDAEILKKMPAEADDLKAYEIALDMENKGYAFYKKVLEGAKAEEAKELYRFLLLEEEAHQEMISNAYEYLKDPAAWFAKEEEPIVEG